MRLALNVLPNSPKTSDLTKREIFRYSMCQRLMEIYDKSNAMLTSTVFNTRQMLPLQGCSETGTFGHSSNHISRSE